MTRASDDAGWVQLAQEVERGLTDTPVPGAVLAVDAPGGRWVCSVGQQLGPGTLLRLSSLTKPVVAAATMSAAQDGVLALTDQVHQWLPELAAMRVLRRPNSDLDDTVPAEQPLTVEDLLTMRLGSGFTYDLPSRALAEAAEVAQLGWGPPVPSSVPHDPDQWLARFAALPLAEQPGRWWRYGAAYSVLGVLLARAEGRGLAEALNARVFGPLGMSDARFHADNDESGRMVDCLVWSGEGDAGLLDPAIGSAWSQPPRFPDGAGGLLGTIDDVLSFGRALLDARSEPSSAASWLSAESVRAMTTDQVPRKQQTGGGNASMFLQPDTWGYGVSLRPPGLGPARYGWAGGLGTFWYSYPEHDTVAVAATQCVPPPVNILNAFFDGLERRLED